MAGGYGIGKGRGAMFFLESRTEKNDFFSFSKYRIL